MSNVWNPPVTFQYANPSIQQAKINTKIDIIGFLSFISSFFFAAVSKFISLYLEIVIVLNIITATYIIAKYIHVFIQASFENINSNLLKSDANSFATNIDMNCDANIPTIIPTVSDNIPTNTVSSKIIFEICLLPIPNVMYIPNSFLRLFIKKLFA